jgi:hypothetical protein
MGLIAFFVLSILSAGVYGGYYIMTEIMPDHPFPVSKDDPSKMLEREKKNCEQFKSQATAQRVFIDKGGPVDDPMEIDMDNDGVACEHLP